MLLSCLDLENRYPRKWIVGSNPTPSAVFQWVSSLNILLRPTLSTRTVPLTQVRQLKNRYDGKSIS